MVKSRNLTLAGVLIASLLAFPGSMAGALLCGILYKYTGKTALAFVGAAMALVLIRILKKTGVIQYFKTEENQNAI